MTLFILWFVVIFLVGLFVGSFLNVCASRLPYEKSLIWPGSRCERCFQPIRWYDNVPILGYLNLRGKCRSCKGRISPSHLLVEVGTAIAFTLLFGAEMGLNLLNLSVLRTKWQVAPGWVPLEALVVFGHHAVLLSFLIVTSLCDLADMEIPLPVTVTGTLVGLVLATLLPWPTPDPVPMAPVPVRTMISEPFPIPTAPAASGAYAWPVWHPLPSWLPAGSWQLGFATGLAGALAGMIVLRGVRFLFGLGRGIEGLGVGDADLMMMAGAFIGWQPVVLAFFVAVGPALVFALAHLAIKGDQALPFGPSLALGVWITVLAWPSLGPGFASMFFDPLFLLVMGGGGSLALLAISFLLRIVRG